MKIQQLFHDSQEAKVYCVDNGRELKRVPYEHLIVLPEHFASVAHQVYTHPHDISDIV